MCLQQRKQKILLNFINNYCTSVAILEFNFFSWDKQQNKMWKIENMPKYKTSVLKKWIHFKCFNERLYPLSSL